MGVVVAGSCDLKANIFWITIDTIVEVTVVIDVGTVTVLMFLKPIIS